MDKVSVEIKRHIGVLTKYPSGWRRELNIVAWNGAEPKYDIRDWNADHSKMSRGITLSEEELAELMKLGSKEVSSK